MKKWIVLLVWVGLTGPAGGQWMDDFESTSESLSSPWESVTSFSTYPGSGYLGSMGVGGPKTGWTNGVAYRPAASVGSNLLHARAYLSSQVTFSNTLIGLFPAKDTSVDNLLIRIESTWYGPETLAITIRSEDFEDGKFVTEQRKTSLITQDALNSWYDLSVKLNGDGTATCHYKKCNAQRWIDAGTVKLYDDFADTYVRLQSGRGGILDDVGYVADDSSNAYMHVNYVAREVCQGCEDGSWKAQFTVTVNDEEEKPVVGALVQATFNGVHNGTYEAVTGANGNAVVRTTCAGRYGATTVTVDNVSKAGKYYVPAKNKVSATRRILYTGPDGAFEKKLISMQQASPDAVMMRQQSAYYEDYLPFDGYSFDLNRDNLAGRIGPTGPPDPNDCSLTWHVFGNVDGNYEDYRENIRAIRETPFKKLTHNFINMHITSPWREKQNWFDDALWESVEKNARIIARIAFEGGCPGLFFDDEAYGYYPVSPWNWKNLAPTCPNEPQDWNAWRDKVYQRGKQFIQAVNKEFPGIHLMFLHGPYSLHSSMADEAGYSAEKMNAYHPPQGVDYSHSEWALIMPFFCGMLEWADAESEIICGSELTYFMRKESEFAIARDIVHDRCKAYSRNPDVYTRKVRMAYGLWLTNEYANLTIRRFTPDQIADVLALGLTYTDRYVWTYCEQSTPWIRNVAEHAPVSNFPMYRSEDNNLAIPATPENAMLHKYYATDHTYFEAMADGKAKAKAAALKQVIAEN